MQIRDFVGRKPVLQRTKPDARKIGIGKALSHHSGYYQSIGKHQPITSCRQGRSHAGHLIGLLRWLSVAYNNLRPVTDARTALLLPAADPRRLFWPSDLEADTPGRKISDQVGPYTGGTTKGLQCSFGCDDVKLSRSWMK